MLHRLETTPTLRHHNPKTITIITYRHIKRSFQCILQPSNILSTEHKNLKKKTHSHTQFAVYVTDTPVTLHPCSSHSPWPPSPTEDSLAIAAMFIIVALLLLLVEAASTEMPLSDIAGDSEARDNEESSGGIGGAPAKEEATDARLVRFSKFPFNAARGLTLFRAGRGVVKKSVSVTRATSSSGFMMLAAARLLKAASFSKEEWTDDRCKSEGGWRKKENIDKVWANIYQNWLLTVLNQ